MTKREIPTAKRIDFKQGKTESVILEREKLTAVYNVVLIQPNKVTKAKYNKLPEAVTHFELLKKMLK